MTTAAIIGIIIIAAYLVLMLLFKHKLALSKFTIILLVICIGTLVISNKLEKNKPVSQQIPSYQQIAPDISKAPYAIATTSRVYYAQNVGDNGKTVTLINFYTYDKKGWQLTQASLPLNRDLYGDIKIYKR